MDLIVVHDHVELCVPPGGITGLKDLQRLPEERRGYNDAVPTVSI
jgi:hypothetical protein